MKQTDAKPPVPSTVHRVREVGDVEKELANSGTPEDVFIPECLKRGDALAWLTAVHLDSKATILFYNCVN